MVHNEENTARSTVKQRLVVTNSSFNAQITGIAFCRSIIHKFITSVVQSTNDGWSSRVMNRGTREVKNNRSIRFVAIV